MAVVATTAATEAVGTAAKCKDRIEHLYELGPRFAAGLSVRAGKLSGLRKLHAADLCFKTAEFGMLVFANAVGDVDEASSIELELGSTRCHVPSNGAHGAAGSAGCWS